MQLMLSLAHAEEMGVLHLSSAELAAGLSVASSLVRKLVLPLARDGLVVSSMGKNGGTRLSRPANEITLADIYTAVTDERRLWSARCNVPHRCLVSSNIVPFFDGIAADAGNAVVELLRCRTLQQSLSELRRIDKSTAILQRKSSDRARRHRRGAPKT